MMPPERAVLYHALLLFQLIVQRERVGPVKRLHRGHPHSPCGTSLTQGVILYKPISGQTDLDSE